MNEELEKEFHFLRNFEIKDFVNSKIEKIVVCENLKTKNVVFVFLKVKNWNWQKYFLDAGAGFWVDTEKSDYNDLDDIEDDENFVFKDYTKKLKVEESVISKIYCEPNDENCQIIIELENCKKIILKSINSKIFDSEIEIVKD